MIENGMMVGAAAHYERLCDESRAWDQAEEAAELATAENRGAYVRELLLDPARTTDLLYQAMAEVSSEADQLCQSAAEMLIAALAGDLPKARLLKILLNLAREAAEVEVPAVKPEGYL